MQDSFPSTKALKAMVNERNKASTCDPKVREGWNSFLEDILHKTGCYKGFGFLKPDEVPGGHAPGINEDRGKLPLALGNKNEDAFDGTDPTRIFFY
jgi:hypothetical protein